jgi:hypothetical protein
VKWTLTVEGRWMWILGSVGQILSVLEASIPLHALSYTFEKKVSHISVFEGLLVPC